MGTRGASAALLERKVAGSGSRQSATFKRQFLPVWPPTLKQDSFTAFNFDK